MISPRAFSGAPPRTATDPEAIAHSHRKGKHAMSTSAFPIPTPAVVVATLLIVAAGCSVPINTGLGAPRPAAPPPAPANAQDPEAEAGAVAYQMGDVGGGREKLERAVSDADDPGEKLALANTMTSIAIGQARRGDHREALRLHQRALELREEVYGKSHPEIAESLNFLGAAYYQLQRYDESEAAFRRAIEVRKRELGPQHRLTALSLNNLAFFYAGRERYAEAEPLFEESIRILSASPEATSAEKARALDNYAAMLLDAGRTEDATQIQQRSAALRTERNRLEDILETTR